MSLERPADGEPHFREAIAIGVAVDDGWKHVESRWQLNYCLVAQDRRAEAEALLEENRVFIYDSGLGGDLNKHWAEEQLIELYENWGNKEQEIAVVRARRALLPPEPPAEDSN